MKKFVNCGCCGKFKNCEDYTFINLCDECDEKTFSMIKECLNQNGPMEERLLHQATGVPYAVIKGYKRHNRLEELERELNMTLYRCTKCGSIVSAPGLCSICRGLNQTPDITSTEEKEGPSWHSRRR